MYNFRNKQTYKSDKNSLKILINQLFYILTKTLQMLNLEKLCIFMY